MITGTFAKVGLVALAAAALTGCPAPDLVPLSRPGVSPIVATAYCNRDAAGRLTIVVANQGTAAVPAETITRVRFFPGGVVDLTTPPLAPGRVAPPQAVPIPAACFNPDCQFTITVDATNRVIESNELNNMAADVCIG